MSTVLFLQKKYLTEAPPLDADLILASAIKKTREFILIHPEYKLSVRQKIRFLYFLLQYRRGLPIAYLTHHKEFFGLDFFVNRHTLIPRPETELIVDDVVKNLEARILNKTILIDVGTGSGCIPIAILKNIKQPIETFAIDISKGALKIAEKNSKLHGVKINFLQGNLLEPILKNPSLYPSPIRGGAGGEAFITANLPYGWSSWKNNGSIGGQSLKFEPAVALFTGENGLQLYRELLGQMKQLNHPFTAFFEFDPRQTGMIKKLIYSIFPKANIEIKKDLAGRDRLAIITSN